MKLSYLARSSWVMLSLATALSLGACNSDSTSRSSSSSTESAKPVALAGPTYSTKSFTMPLDVHVPAWLEPTAAEDTANFVTFGASDGSRAVRILRPVVVYPPGSSETAPVPKDYVSYLLGQANSGAKFTDLVKSRVDRRPATLVTGRTNQSIDGSLGCPGTGIAADDCFGLQPEFLLQLAVISTDSGPLLVWLRTDVDDADPKASAQQFDQFLAGVRFSTRAVATEAAQQPTSLDGTYRWRLTKRDARTHGAASDQTREGLAMYPDTFTVTLKAGNWEMTETRFDDTGSGSYEVTGNRIVFHWDLTTLQFDLKRSPNGTLHLHAVQPMNDGDRFVWTTRPWTLDDPLQGSGGARP